jgi:hypothetical protein
MKRINLKKKKRKNTSMNKPLHLKQKHQNSGALFQAPKQTCGESAQPILTEIHTQNVQQCGEKLSKKRARIATGNPPKIKKKERNAQQIQDIISDFLPSLIHSLKSMITSSDDDHEQWGGASRSSLSMIASSDR